MSFTLSILVNITYVLDTHYYYVILPKQAVVSHAGGGKVALQALCLLKNFWFPLAMPCSNNYFDTYTHALTLITAGASLED